MNGLNQASGINRRRAAGLVAAMLATGAIAASAVRSLASGTGGSPFSTVPHWQRGSARMTHDLATLSADHFEALIGETFTIGDHHVTLREVRRQKMRSRLRQQFSLLFNAPRDLPLRSESLTVIHPAIGRHELLVTQVLDGSEGTALEICFS